MSKKKEHCIIDGQEHELSPSMTSWGGGRWLIPVCRVCVHYKADKKSCIKFDPIPEGYLSCEKYDCPEREIDFDNLKYTLIKKELGLQ